MCMSVNSQSYTCIKAFSIFVYIEIGSKLEIVKVFSNMQFLRINSSKFSASMKVRFDKSCVPTP